MHRVAYLERLPKTLLFGGSVVCIAGLGWLDYLTGYDVNLSVFYALPVIFAVWFVGRTAGIAASLLSVSAWFIADHLAGHPYHVAWVPLWNAGVRFLFLLLTVTGAHYTRSQILFNEERAESLERALPVCSCCKKIRDEHGSWIALEAYVMEQLSAVPTAKLCPDCAKQRYIDKMAPGSGIFPLR